MLLNTSAGPKAGRTSRNQSKNKKKKGKNKNEKESAGKTPFSSKLSDQKIEFVEQSSMWGIYFKRPLEIAK